MKAFSPRPRQQEVLDYPGGRMGVSAVPGSGKTWTLSLLAAAIVAGGELADDQEVLVVTLVNSAVDNFYQRVSAFVEEYGILPHLGYRVRTLHGLAHDIVRERPELVGLAEDFQIVDEREADNIVAQALASWLHSHPDALDGYLSQELDENDLGKVYRDQLPELVKSIGPALSVPPRISVSHPSACASAWRSCPSLCRWRRWAARSTPITSVPWLTAGRWISTI